MLDFCLGKILVWVKVNPGPITRYTWYEEEIYPERNASPLQCALHTHSFHINGNASQPVHLINEFREP